MKVLYLTPSVRMMGARVSLRELLVRIQSYGIEPVVAAPFEGPLTADLRAQGVRVAIIRYRNWRKMKYLFLHPFSLRNLRRLAGEERISMVHSNEFWVNPFGYRIAKALGVPCICHFRCSRGSNLIPPSKLKSYSLHKVDRVIAISRSQLNVLSFLDLYRVPITVVYNGVDTNRFTPPVDRIGMRRRLGLDPSLPTLGLIGVISPHKGQLDFITAIKQVRDAGHRVNALIVGSTRDFDYLRQCHAAVSEYGLGDMVTFMDYRSDIENVFQALDMHVTPSSEEAFGRVNIEAMASGVPVVGYWVGGIPEVVTHGRNGLLMSRGQNQLGTTILQLLQQPERLREMGEAARMDVIKRFSMLAYVEGVLKVYREVLAQAGSPLSADQVGHDSAAGDE
ncbi:glycosyltransferase family 4 protein [bacterium]|nr:glycosyltransferase family 4 protein [candidate division CSSED10-310 bacterium]